MVEAILSCLPTRDLLLVQRVSKQFRLLLQSSTQLRQKLHLTTTDTGPKQLFHTPLLSFLQILPNIHKPYNRSGPFLEGCDRSINPGAPRDVPKSRPNNERYSIRMRNVPDYLWQKHRPSWRDMHVTSPLSTDVTLVVYSWAIVQSDHELRDEGGWTLGKLADKAADMARFKSDHDLCFEFHFL